jgi:hypothetical protein
MVAAQSMISAFSEHMEAAPGSELPDPKGLDLSVVTGLGMLAL